MAELPLGQLGLEAARSGAARGAAGAGPPAASGDDPRDCPHHGYGDEQIWIRFPRQRIERHTPAGQVVLGRGAKGTFRDCVHRRHGQ
eukprot:4618744-Pyramimonas_sp.AAC.1